MHIVRNPRNVLSGLLFIGLAAVFAWQGWSLPMGSSVRMGPGYFPLLLSGLLAFLGFLVLIDGLRSPGKAPSGVVWRALLLLSGSVVFFGFAVRPLGFLPALAISVFVSALASQKFDILRTVVLTA